MSRGSSHAIAAASGWSCRVGRAVNHPAETSGSGAPHRPRSAVATGWQLDLARAVAGLCAPPSRQPSQHSGSVATHKQRSSGHARQRRETCGNTASTMWTSNITKTAALIMPVIIPLRSGNVKAAAGCLRRRFTCNVRLCWAKPRANSQPPGVAPDKLSRPCHPVDRFPVGPR